MSEQNNRADDTELQDDALEQVAGGSLRLPTDPIIITTPTMPTIPTFPSDPLILVAE
jgi:hypothetical protein